MAERDGGVTVAKGKRSTVRRKVKRAAKVAGPVAVSSAALGELAAVHVKRGGKMFVHHFSKATLHAVDGRPGVLVIRGAFKVDGQGFIHNGK